MHSKTHRKKKERRNLFVREHMYWHLRRFEITEESLVVLERKLALSEARGSGATSRRNSKRKGGRRTEKTRFRHLRSVRVGVYVGMAYVGVWRCEFRVLDVPLVGGPVNIVHAFSRLTLVFSSRIPRTRNRVSPSVPSYIYDCNRKQECEERSGHDVCNTLTCLPFKSQFWNPDCHRRPSIFQLWTPGTCWKSHPSNRTEAGFIISYW